MEHVDCRKIEDSMALELRRYEKVIKTYKEMLLAAGVRLNLVEDAANEAYRSIY